MFVVNIIKKTYLEKQKLIVDTKTKQIFKSCSIDLVSCYNQKVQ